MAYTTPIALQTGMTTTLIDAAVATGFAKSQQFVVPPSPVPGQHRAMNYVATLVGAFTSLVLSVEVSDDAGATWKTLVSNINLLTDPAGIIPLLATGLRYRFNVTGFADGTSVSLTGTLA